MKVTEAINKIEKLELTFDDIYNNDFELDIDKSLLEELITKYDNKQMAFKILMNSLFGALDNKYFFIHERNMSGSITFVGRFMIQFTSKKVNEYLQNVFKSDKNYIIYSDTDSFYFSLEDFVKLIENKMNKKYEEMSYEEKEKLLNTSIKFIEKINEVAENAIKEIQEKLNVKEPGFMGFKVEKINEKGIWIAKKRYALKTIWNEGTILINKPKLSVTGLEIVRSSTPDFVIDKLEKALLIMMDKNEKDLQDFVQQVKKEFYEKCETNPEVIAKTSSVNNLNYKKDKKGYYRLNEKGIRIACPINSRAAILHNELININGLWDIYPLIVEGDKIKYIPLKLPNPVNENVIGFIDEGFLFDLDLIKYIDKEQAFQTNFLQPLKLIADAIDYKFEKSNKIDLNEW